MGRSYYCEYCDKRMKCSVNIRKNHNEGLPHKIAKAEYMAQFKDPRDILREERKKTPCSRFLNGKECKFGLFCHFSHYRPDQLQELEKIAQKLTNKQSTTNKELQDKPEQPFPWKYPQEKVENVQLPPSLLPYNIEMCSVYLSERGEWG